MNRAHAAAAGLAALALACSGGPTVDPGASAESLHRAYLAACIDHDLGALRVLTAPDAERRFAARVLKGRDAVLGPDAYEAGLRSKLNYDHVTVRGDTVDCMMTERNELITALGLTSIRRFPRLVFRNGLLVRREDWQPSADMRELEGRMGPFHSWARAYHPEAVERLLDAERRLVFTRESGEEMRKLAREYTVVTRGGAKAQK